MVQYFTLALFIQIWFTQLFGLYCSQVYIQELLNEQGDAMKEADYDYD